MGCQPELGLGALADKCSHVLSLVRTPADFSDEVDSRLKKLEQKIIDFDALSSETASATE